MIVEQTDTYVVEADLVPEPMTEREMRALYPSLNEAGIANYLLLANRRFTPEFRALLASRRLSGECLTQPRISEGQPWLSDCLTHGVAASLGHHFATHPDAETD